MEGYYIRLKNPANLEEIIPYMFYVEFSTMFGICDEGLYKGEKLYLCRLIMIDKETGEIIRDKYDTIVIDSHIIEVVKEW